MMKKKDKSTFTTYEILIINFYFLISLGTFILEKNENIYNALLFFFLYLICLYAQAKITEKKYFMQQGEKIWDALAKKGLMFMGKEIQSEEDKIRHEQRYLKVNALQKKFSRRALSYALMGVYGVLIFINPNLHHSFLNIIPMLTCFFIIIAGYLSHFLVPVFLNVVGVLYAFINYDLPLSAETFLYITLLFSFLILYRLVEYDQILFDSNYLEEQTTISKERIKSLLKTTIQCTFIFSLFLVLFASVITEQETKYTHKLTQLTKHHLQTGASAIKKYIVRPDWLGMDKTDTGAPLKKVDQQGPKSTLKRSKDLDDPGFKKGEGKIKGAPSEGKGEITIGKPAQEGKSNEESKLKEGQQKLSGQEKQKGMPEKDQKSGMTKAEGSEDAQTKSQQEGKEQRKGEMKDDAREQNTKQKSKEGISKEEKGELEEKGEKGRAGEIQEEKKTETAQGKDRQKRDGKGQDKLGKEDGSNQMKQQSKGGQGAGKGKGQSGQSKQQEGKGKSIPKGESKSKEARQAGEKGQSKEDKGEGKAAAGQKGSGQVEQDMKPPDSKQQFQQDQKEDKKESKKEEKVSKQKDTDEINPWIWAIIIFSCLLLVALVSWLVYRRYKKGPIVYDIDERKSLSGQYKEIGMEDLTKREEIVAYYNFFIKMAMPLLKVKKQIPPSDLAKTLSVHYPEMKEYCDNITEIFCNTYYGSDPITAETYKLYHESLKKVVHYFRVT